MLSHGSLWVSEASYAMVGDVTIAKKGENNSCLAPGGSIHEGSSLVHVKSFSKPTSTSVQGVVHSSFRYSGFKECSRSFPSQKVVNIYCSQLSANAALEFSSEELGTGQLVFAQIPCSEYATHPQVRKLWLVVVTVAQWISGNAKLHLLRAAKNLQQDPFGTAGLTLHFHGIMSHHSATVRYGQFVFQCMV